MSPTGPLGLYVSGDTDATKAVLSLATTQGRLSDRYHDGRARWLRARQIEVRTLADASLSDVITLNQIRVFMQFYLGTHEPGWLRRTSAPLFVSIRRESRFVRNGQSRAEWCLDSGGFTEIAKSGRWTKTSGEYADVVQRLSDEIGGLRWAAIQDWMCDPRSLQKTRKSVAEHQSLTVDSWVSLSRLAPQISWTPVLQGWEPDEYLQHLQAYRNAGLVPDRVPVVGIGSIAARQGDPGVVRLVQTLAAEGIRLHGFGIKIRGLQRLGPYLHSADSAAWSYQARKRPALPGCTHARCNNCLRYALRWRSQVLRVTRSTIAHAQR